MRRPPSFRRVLLLFLVTTLGVGPALSQNFNATLSGLVTDPKGALFPGVNLTLTSVTTGAVSTATTNGKGEYTFPNMAPVPYTLRATAKGFRDYVQQGILLLMNQNVTNNIQSNWDRQSRPCRCRQTPRPSISVPRR